MKPVLLVDDDPLFCRAFTRTLARGPYRAVVATDPAQARQRLAEEPRLVLAIVDYRLKVDTGLAVIRAVRAERPDLKIVLLSAYCSTWVVVEAMKIGAADCLPKSSGLGWIDRAIAGERPVGRAGDHETPSPAFVEWNHLQQVMRDCGGNVSEAARRLGLHRSSLQRKLSRPRPLK